VPGAFLSVLINNEPRAIPVGTSVAALLVGMNLERAAVAVEVNRTLIPKRSHATTPLAQGDCVELVTLVGGG
jgi:thiamine biosynthesis protein ThiS